jgi:hypothetical protein
MNYVRELRNVLREWLAHEQRKLARVRLKDAAGRLSRRVRRFGLLLKGGWDESRHPRASDGRFGDVAGEHGGGDQGEHGTGKPPGHARPIKALKAASRYRDPGRRRRVIAAVKVEGELSDAIGGHNLENSLPADVAYIQDASGAPVVGRENVRRFLHAREHAARLVSRHGTPAPAREAAERILALPCEFFEVKTLLTSPKHAVHMSKQARARKERWAEKYHAGFSVVAVDRRRGKKHSGHHGAYVSVGELAGTHRLEHMDKVDSFSAVLSAVCPSCKGGKR